MNLMSPCSNSLSAFSRRPIRSLWWVFVFAMGAAAPTAAVHPGRSEVWREITDPRISADGERAVYLDNGRLAVAATQAGVRGESSADPGQGSVPAMVARRDQSGVSLGTCGSGTDLRAAIDGEASGR